MMTFGFRRGWGWLLLAALTLSTIGDEITLITLMFRTAGDHAALAIPLLLIAQLVPGLLAAPCIGRLTDRRDAGVILILASLAQAAIVAWLAFSASLPATIVGASILGLLFAISGTATFALIPVLAQGLGMTLARANAGLEFVRSAGMLAGPVVGGILVSWGGRRRRPPQADRAPRSASRRSRACARWRRCGTRPPRDRRRRGAGPGLPLRSGPSGFRPRSCRTGRSWRRCCSAAGYCAPGRAPLARSGQEELRLSWRKAYKICVSKSDDLSESVARD